MATGYRTGTSDLMVPGLYQPHVTRLHDAALAGMPPVSPPWPATTVQVNDCPGVMYAGVTGTLSDPASAPLESENTVEKLVTLAVICVLLVNVIWYAAGSVPPETGLPATNHGVAPLSIALPLVISVPTVHVLFSEAVAGVGAAAGVTRTTLTGGTGSAVLQAAAPSPSVTAANPAIVICRAFMSSPLKVVR